MTEEKDYKKEIVKAACKIHNLKMKRKITNILKECVEKEEDKKIKCPVCGYESSDEKLMINHHFSNCSKECF